MPPVGEGRFGRVYRAKDYRTQKKVAIKVVKLLGENLQQLMGKCAGKKFRIETAMKLTIQMFNRIRELHRSGFVHRDIKLNNYVCALTDEDPAKSALLKKKPRELQIKQNKDNQEDDGDDGTVYLIDYGITKKVENQELQQKIQQQIQLASSPMIYARQNTFEDKNDNFLEKSPLNKSGQKKERQFVGTFIFASISQLKKEPMTYKDDLESLGYIIVGMITGSLPWKDLCNAKLDDNLEQLIKLRNPKTLCAHLPREISQFIYDIQKLKADEMIKYKYFKGLLMRVYKTINYTENFKYDWILEEEKLKEEYFRGLTKNKIGEDLLSNRQDQKEISSPANPSYNANINQNSRNMNNIDIKISDLSYTFHKKDKRKPSLNNVPQSMLNSSMTPGMSQFKKQRNMQPLMIDPKKNRGVSNNHNDLTPSSPFINKDYINSAVKSGKRQVIKRYKKKIKIKKGATVEGNINEDDEVYFHSNFLIFYQNGSEESDSDEEHKDSTNNDKDKVKNGLDDSIQDISNDSDTEQKMPQQNQSSDQNNSQNQSILSFIGQNRKSILPERRRQGIRLNPGELMSFMPYGDEKGTSSKHLQLGLDQIQSNVNVQSNNNNIPVSKLSNNFGLNNNSTLKPPPPRDNQFLRLQTGEVNECDLSEGEVDITNNMERYTFEDPKQKVKDSRFRQFIDLKDQEKFSKSDSRVGNGAKLFRAEDEEIKIQQNHQGKKSSNFVGPRPSSD
eukprot:403371434